MKLYAALKHAHRADGMESAAILGIFDSKERAMECVKADMARGDGTPPGCTYWGVSEGHELGARVGHFYPVGPALMLE